MGNIRLIGSRKDSMRQKTFLALVFLVMVTLGRVSIGNIFDLPLHYSYSIHTVQL